VKLATAPSSDQGKRAPASRPIRQLSAVMPVYNEEKVLPQSLAEAVGALQQLCELWELIIVDDGSTDSTPLILTGWAKKESRIRVLRQPTNQGYSAALIRGFSTARYDLVFYTDGDAQFDLEQILDLHDQIEGADMVVGYRQRRQDPGVRLLTSAVFNRLQGWVLGVRVRDVNCAFKLFRRPFLQGLPLSSDGFLIDAELFARARRAGGSWREIPVTHRERADGSSTVRVRTIWDTLRQLWDVRRSLR